MTTKPTVLFACIHNSGRSVAARYEDWPVDDPAGQDIGTVRHIIDDIDTRVRALIEVLRQ